MNELLRDARRAKGLTQGQMARHLGFRSTSHYCMIERGQRRLTVDKALIVARVLGRSVEDLFSAPTTRASA